MNVAAVDGNVPSDVLTNNDDPPEMIQNAPTAGPPAKPPKPTATSPLGSQVEKTTTIAEKNREQIPGGKSK